MENVLCIFCYRRVFILDMDEILSGDDYNDGTSPKLPPLRRVIDFVESGLPLGMGVLKMGNFLYMFGGEYPSEDPHDSIYRIRNSDGDLFEHAYRTMVVGLGIPDEDPPCHAFRLDLSNHQSEPVQLRSMLGPKLYAVVEEIRGQIYVLSRRRVSTSRPLFEVWNPMTGEWRSLPDPPPFSDGEQIWSYCVCGGDIICEIGISPFYRFSTVSEKWECVVDLSSRQVIAMTGGRFDVRYGDVYLELCGADRNLCATMDGPEQMDGYTVEVEFSETEQQGCSVEVESSETRPQLPGFELVSVATVADTREQGGYMCGLVTYVSNEGFALYVFVFQIEKLESEKLLPSQAALSVRYLKRKVYDFTHMECKNEEFPLLVNFRAVIGRILQNTSSGKYSSSSECSRGESKRKREEVDDDGADNDDETCRATTFDPLVTSIIV